MQVGGSTCRLWSLLKLGNGGGGYAGARWCVRLLVWLAGRAGAPLSPMQGHGHCTDPNEAARNPTSVMQCAKRQSMQRGPRALSHSPGPATYGFIVRGRDDRDFHAASQRPRVHGSPVIDRTGQGKTVTEAACSRPSFLPRITSSTGRL